MKKTLLITQHFPPHPGGAQNYYYQLCEHMNAESIVVLADDSHNEQYKHLMREFDYPVYYRRFYSRFFWPRWVKLLRHAFKIARKENVAMLWAGEPLPKGVVALIVSKILGIPYFVTTHGADVLNPICRSGPLGMWKKTLLVSVLKGAVFVTANSKYTKSIIEELGVKNDAVVVVYPTAQNTPPAPTQIEDFTMRNIAGMKQSGKKIILCVSRVVTRKGIDKTIEAIHGIVATCPNMAYVVFGDGPAKHALEDKVKELGIANHVIFTGALSDESLKKAYELADVFVMIPREEEGLIEGFGIVYIEAGLFGVPVIGSRVGGVPEAIVEYVGDNVDTATGLLVDNPTDTKQIAKNILMLLKNDDLARRLGQNGAKRAQRFTWQKGADEIVKRLR